MNDVSEWIGQSYSKAYAFAMGRVKEHNGRLSCATAFAFDELYGKGVLNASHLSAAEFITTLKEVAFTRTGFGRMQEMIREIQGSCYGGDYCPMTLYMAITRAMPPQHLAMAERICSQPLRTNDWPWIMKHADNIRQSFDSLGACIEKGVDIMKQKAEDSRIKRA